MTDATDGDAGPDPPTPPIFTYGHSVGRCAVIGGYVVHDPRLHSLHGRYLYTGLCKGMIRILLPGLNRTTHHRGTGLRAPVPSSFGEGRRGRI